MAQFSFQNLGEGKWGIKCSASLDQAVKFGGKTVTVWKRDGSCKEVRLGRILDRWNGGRAAVYEIARAS